jgi:uncharacterized protein YecE (DUF72 family)
MDTQSSFHFLSTNDNRSDHLPFAADFFPELARRQQIHVGTNSWKFRGWEGLLYGRRYQSEAEFQRESFREYSTYLNCVGIDFTYYNWPMASQMVTLSHQSPQDFRFTLKVTDKIVTQKFPNLPRYGRFAGKENPQFLDPQAYLDFFWQPLEPLAEKIGLVIFEFPHLNLSHLDRLDAFFSAIPRGIPIALELRNRELFGREFYQWLLERGL